MAIEHRTNAGMHMTLVLTPPIVGLPPIKVVVPAHPEERCNRTHFICSTPTQATGHIQIAQGCSYTRAIAQDKIR